MLFSQESEYPWWFTLGGDPGRSAANTDEMAWANVIVCAVGAVVIFAGSGLWLWRARQLPPFERGPLYTNSLLYAVGAMSCFVIRAVMTWIPAWMPYFVLLILTICGGVKACLDLLSSRVSYTPSKRVAEKAKEVAAIASRIAPFARRESDKAVLFKKVAELNAILNGEAP